MRRALTFLFHDLADLRFEAHVQHAVCLVQHQVSARHAPAPHSRDGLQADVVALQQVQHAARRAHQDVAAAAQRRQRVAHGRAAVDDRRGDARAVAELVVTPAGGGYALGLLVDLQGQLARGGEDQCGGVELVGAGHFRKGRLGRTIAEHRRDDREEEACRLAGACE